MKAGRIIVLNGTSSSGKSSLAKALQDKLDEPYVHLLIEELLPKLPERYLTGQHPDGVQMAKTPDGGLYVTAGPVAERVVAGFYAAVAAIASAGNNVIVDTLMGDPFDAEECARRLDGLDVLMVGVQCPLGVLEQRERERGDRTPGLARGELSHVHEYALYDLEVDTSVCSPAESAAMILAAIGTPRGDSAIARMRARYAYAKS
jgi:chloramphenicol 3-O phosphotransferase